MHKKSLGSVSNTRGMNGAIQIQLHFIYLVMYHSSEKKKKYHCNPHQQAPAQVAPHLVPNLTTIQIPLQLNQTMKPIADINTYHICSVT
jgi:hypothetical protein